MKKLLPLLLLAIMANTLQAQAPELKNMMPNSWQKLSRLEAEEEREFLGREEVLSEIMELQRTEFRKRSLEEINMQVFTETNLGLQFFRVLLCASPLETVYNAEYKNKTITEEECLKMQGGEDCIWQIVFMKDKTNALQNILVRPYAQYWASQGKWEGYEFNDLMIKPLNKNEIGFFITEARVSFTVDREKMSQDIVPINYSTLKGQIDGSNATYFLKYNINDDIDDVWSNDGVRIQASHYLFDSRCPLKYSIQNAFDGNPATSYVENTEDDLMKIEFSGFKSKFSKKVALGIINGYALNEKYYYANNRIIGLNANSYRINDEKTELIAREPIQLILKDGIYKYQILSFDYNNRVGSFSFSTAKIIKGNSFNDTCIAEINLSETDNFVFGEINE